MPSPLLHLHTPNLTALVAALNRTAGVLHYFLDAIIISRRARPSTSPQQRAPASATSSSKSPAREEVRGVEPVQHGGDQSISRVLRATLPSTFCSQPLLRLTCMLHAAIRGRRDEVEENVGSGGQLVGRCANGSYSTFFAYMLLERRAGGASRGDQKTNSLVPAHPPN